MGEIHGVEIPIGTYYRQCYDLLSSTWQTKSVGRSVMYWLCTNKCPKKGSLGTCHAAPLLQKRYETDNPEKNRSTKK
jgi:hypothetical protein